MSNNMISKPTITIGIPVYNEEANIKLLLKALLSQKLINVELKEIIITSDGSNDQTVPLARSIPDPRVIVFNNPDRKGASIRQNEIIENTHGDILVMLNGDAMPADDNFIEEIVAPLLKDSTVGLVAADTIAVPPQTFIENILGQAHELKKHMYRQINSGNSSHMCTGLARAFSRQLYSQMHWESDLPEDAFSYLICIKLGFKFYYARNARILFRVPATLEDYIKQSQRFAGGKEKMMKYFTNGFAEREYHIPLKVWIKSSLLFIPSHPISVLGFFLNIYIRLFKPKIVYQSKWKISETTKLAINKNNDKSTQMPTS